MSKKNNRIEVLGDNVLVREVKGTDVLGREVSERMEVAFVGPDVKSVKPGDSVFYQHGVTVRLHDEEYKLVKEEEIIAKL